MFLLLNMYLHIAWCLHSIVDSETVSESSLSSLLLKRGILFEQLEYFIDNLSGVQQENKYGNQLASRVNIL